MEREPWILQKNTLEAFLWCPQHGTWGKGTVWNKSYSPGALWEYRYSGTEANFDPKSWSCGMGEPSRDRHSGVCRPLEWGDSRPGWVGEAGALLKHQNIVLASAGAFWPQDSSRDPELCPAQDSLGRTALLWKAHRDSTNTPAPNTVVLLLAEGNQSRFNISLLDPLLTENPQMLHAQISFITSSHSQRIYVRVWQGQGEEERCKSRQVSGSAYANSAVASPSPCCLPPQILGSHLWSQTREQLYISLKTNQNKKLKILLLFPPRFNREKKRCRRNVPWNCSS